MRRGCREFHSFLDLLKRGIEEGLLSREEVLAAMEEIKEQPMASRRSRSILNKRKAHRIWQPTSFKHDSQNRFCRYVLEDGHAGTRLHVEIGGRNLYLGSSRSDLTFFGEIMWVHYSRHHIDFRMKEGLSWKKRVIRISRGGLFVAL